MNGIVVILPFRENDILIQYAFTSSRAALRATPDRPFYNFRATQFVRQRFRTV